MAIYPCDVGNHRYPQPQQSVYLTRMYDHDILTRTLRLCPSHFRAKVISIGDLLDDIADVPEGGHACKICDNALDVRVYCRAFAAKAEEQAFAGEFCASHWNDVALQLSFDDWRPMRARTEAW